MKKADLHIKTPLIESLPLSECVNGKVWLKMESLQPSGSFKLRGVGYACRHYVSNGAKKLISSSGGNAGIAVAYSGRKLGVPVTVVVPETTTQSAIAAIQQQKAEVIIKGESWQEAHDYSRDLTDSTSVHIHPFDDPLLWIGHATLMDEIAEIRLKPDAVVLSVGGGGLLCGVIEGLNNIGMPDVTVLAVETAGADSLAASLEAQKHVGIEKIESIATSLGAKKVSEGAYARACRHVVVSHVVTDRQAVDACLSFAKDHRVLVEPACGASLSAVYDPPEFLRDKNCILVIVCGGAGVTFEQLQNWKENLG